MSLICSRELGQVNLQEVSTSCWIWFPALFFLFHFLCSSSSFSLLFSCFLILHCMPMRKWNMSDYCVPETKACQEQVFLLVNALQCHTQDVQPQTSSLPWVPTLHGISSVHQHALAHRKEKTKQALKSRFMAPKPLNYRQVNRSGKPHGAGGHHTGIMCHSSGSFIQMDTTIYYLLHWLSCQGLLLPTFPTLLPTSPSSSERISLPNLLHV